MINNLVGTVFLGLSVLSTFYGSADYSTNFLIMGLYFYLSNRIDEIKDKLP